MFCDRRENPRILTSVDNMDHTYSTLQKMTEGIDRIISKVYETVSPRDYALATTSGQTISYSPEERAFEVPLAMFSKHGLRSKGHTQMHQTGKVHVNYHGKEAIIDPADSRKQPGETLTSFIMRTLGVSRNVATQALKSHK